MHKHAASTRPTSRRRRGSREAEVLEGPFHPIQSHPLPPSERADAGRAMRAACPRRTHDTWQGAHPQREPIELLLASSIGRIESLLPIRYGRMAASPFAFYRGAAAVMAYDLSLTPNSGPRLQCCGDCHLLNFGGFATPERHIAFDINDFDETLVAPWEWDLKRLAASFTIAGRANGFDKAACDEAAWWATRAYREWMGRYAHMPILDAWYDNIDLRAVIDAVEDEDMRRYARAKFNRAVDKSASAREFAKLAFSAGKRPRIKDEPPLIYHTYDVEEEQTQFSLKAVYTDYLASMPSSRRVLLDRYEVADIATKVVGVGSVGTECGIVLLVSGNGDPLFLQYKEARRSVLEPYAGQSPYNNHGQRVVVGQQIMQAASDAFLGWTVSRPSNLRNYAKLCGRALARAHARSGDATMLAAYMGSSDAFEDALTRFAQSYADQNERDHAALLAAIRAGKIEARFEG
jgi:uncharacterized protein (DUF2252 family)